MKTFSTIPAVLGWSLGWVLQGFVINADPATLSWGFTLDGYPITEPRLKNLQSETGIRADFIVFFLQWPEPGAAPVTAFPRETLDAIWNQGAAPCITWEPMFLKEGKEITVPGRQILEGRYDPYLKTFAREARAWKKPLMIRFAHEMNLRRYHWGTETAAYGPESPALYRKMFRHVVTLFRKEGANNVRWIFCPNADSIPNPAGIPPAAWNQAGNYYPGQEFVDILGMDGYNWGTTQTTARHGWDSRWISFKQIFQGLHEELRALAPGKPILIMETSCVCQNGDQVQWITGLMETAQRWNLAGVCWFQVNKEQDWRLQGGNAAGVAHALKSGGKGRAQDWLRSLKP